MKYLVVGLITISISVLYIFHIIGAIHISDLITYSKIGVAIGVMGIVIGAFAISGGMIEISYTTVGYIRESDINVDIQYSNYIDNMRYKYSNSEGD